MVEIITRRSSRYIWRTSYRIPDEYPLKSKGLLLFGREVLTALVAQLTHADTTC